MGGGATAITKNRGLIAGLAIAVAAAVAAAVFAVFVLRRRKNYGAKSEEEEGPIEHVDFSDNPISSAQAGNEVRRDDIDKLYCNPIFLP